MKEINYIFDNYFGLIVDERCENKIKYTLIDILKILIIGVLCGLDKITEIVDYAKSKNDFLLREFQIEKIASVSTFERVLSIIKSEFLSLILYKINVELLAKNYEEIHFDGKVIRATEMISKFDKALNIVTAYTETGISLYQETVYEKTNEIPTVQSMLELVDVKGKIISADALHCQKETAKAIIANGGDYLLQLKSNQKNIYEDFKIIFEEKLLNENDFEIHETIEKSHGRIETRKYIRIKNKDYYKDGYFDTYFKEWEKLTDVIAVIRIVEENNKTRKEKSLYITSLDIELNKIAKHIRNHWCIESMHHILDVSFNEDKCYLGSKNAQENMNILRKFSTMIHKNYKEEKGKSVKSMSNNMFKCLINENHLLDVIEFAKGKYVRQEDIT